MSCFGGINIKNSKKPIIYCIILFVFLIFTLGCLEEETNNNDIIEPEIISFEDLYNNLENYTGENITMEGYVENGKGANQFLPYIADFCNTNKTKCILIDIPPEVVIFNGNFRIFGEVFLHNETSIPVINVKSSEKIQNMIFEP
jgi:hypothetical protein